MQSHSLLENAFLFDSPPTTNQRMTVRNGRMILSKVAREYFEENRWNISLALNKMGNPDPIDFPVYAQVWMFSKGDTDGCLKILFDLLEKAKIIKNDRLIQGHGCVRMPHTELKKIGVILYDFNICSATSLTSYWEKGEMIHKELKV